MRLLPARDDVTEQIHSLKREAVEFRDAVGPLLPVLQPFTTAREDWPHQIVPLSSPSPRWSPGSTPIGARAARNCGWDSSWIRLSG
ncbi:hypothetical protein [Streptomyces sp. NPDC001286]